MFHLGHGRLCENISWKWLAQGEVGWPENENDPELMPPEIWPVDGA